MTPGLVSVFSLTIDRYELTKETITKNFERAKQFAPIEWLVADNGSKDRRVVEFVARHPLLAYHRVNSKNEGVSHAFNQLYLRSKGEYLCFMGSDLELPEGWLQEMLGYLRTGPNIGMVPIVTGKQIGRAHV